MKNRFTETSPLDASKFEQGDLIIAIDPVAPEESKRLGIITHAFIKVLRKGKLHCLEDYFEIIKHWGVTWIDSGETEEFENSNNATDVVRELTSKGCIVRRAAMPVTLS